MHIAFASEYDATDVANWSGLPTFIARALEDAGASIEYLGPLRRTPAPVSRVRQVGARLRGGRHLLDRDARVMRGYARQLERQVKASKPDVVFAVSTIPIAYLECEPPIGFWTGATFGSLLGFYPEFSRLTGASVRRGHAAERSALGRVGLAIYASAWGADSARRLYSVPEAKLRVVPYGANLTAPPPAAEVEEMIASRCASLGEKCRLLFVGIDWARKGGSLAVDVARGLNERGIPTELTVVGNVPPGERLPPYVRAVGPVSKATEGGERKLAALYARSHFFVLPTTAEVAGVVFAEASAFGVPSLAPDLGGVGDMMGPGGALMRSGATASEYVEAIMRPALDIRLYQRMATAALNDSAARLNWRTAGQTAIEHLTELVAAPHA